MTCEGQGHYDVLYLKKKKRKLMLKICYKCIYLKEHGKKKEWVLKRYLTNYYQYENFLLRIEWIYYLRFVQTVYRTIGHLLAML